MKVKIGPYKNKRKVEITIDEYDTWSMDHTLALIILPMLKQLKKTKHGSPTVDNDDVPCEMRFTNYEHWDSQQCFEFYHEPQPARYANDIHDRWDWVLNEMIWTFKQIVKDDDSKFYDHSKCKKSLSINEQIKCIKVDWEGLKNYQNRIQNGCRLFGKYYQNLWD